MIEIESTGIEDTVDAGTKSVNTMKQRFNTYLEKLAESTVSEARSNLQNNMNVNTGSLAASIGILENNGGWDIVVGTNEPYAGFIEYGRGPVNPVSAKTLHWIDKTTGKDVFAKSSKATDPSPFLEPAVVSNTKKFPRVFVDYESQYLRDLGFD